MYTQCPDCLTVFSLDAETLAPAGGHVQCGHCDHLFNALATLSRQLPPEPFVHLAEPVAPAAPPRLELAVYRPRPEPAAVAAHDPSGRDDFSALVFTPRFARGRGRGRHPDDRAEAFERGERRWPWVVVCIALTLLLGAQVAWAQRAVLLTDPVIGGWLRQGCTTLGCRLPLMRDVAQLRLVARDVEANPNVPEALMISASIRNDAPFSQPYPVLSLVLADTHGKRLAMRRLRPSEYLGDRETERAGMAPGATTAIVLEFADPGRKAVAFEFDFE